MTIATGGNQLRVCGCGRVTVCLGRREQAHRICPIVPHLDLAVDLRQIDALDATGSPGEVLVHQILAEAERFENLRSAVALNRRNAHLRRHLDDTLHRRFNVVVNRGVVIDIDEQPVLDHLVQRFHRQIRVDCRRAKTDQQSQVMDLTRFA